MKGIPSINNHLELNFNGDDANRLYNQKLFFER